MLASGRGLNLVTVEKIMDVQLLKNEEYEKYLKIIFVWAILFNLTNY